MPKVLTLDQLKRQIAAGSLDPVYFVGGRDERGKADALDALVETIDPAIRAFNVDRFDGLDAATSAVERRAIVDRVVAAARTLPWLAERRLVILQRADRLAKRRGKAAAEEPADEPADAGSAADVVEPLIAYLKSPEPLTALVVEADAMDRGTRFGKTLYAQATIVDCSGFDDARDAASWVQREAAADGRSLDRDAVRLIVNDAGGDADRLRATLARAVAFAGDRTAVTAEDVQAVLRSATSTDPWALVNEIERGAVGPALRELALALADGGVPVMILGQLGWYVRTKLAPHRIPAAVEALLRTDVDLKSSAGDPRILLERLVIELCGAERDRGGIRRSS
jgi:DNA polymerase-3 subunit delta